MQYCRHVQIPTCACGGLAFMAHTRVRGSSLSFVWLSRRGRAHTVQLYASMKQVKRIPAAHAHWYPAPWHTELCIMSHV